MFLRKLKNSSASQTLRVSRKAGTPSEVLPSPEFPTSSKPRARAKRFSIPFRGTTPTLLHPSGSWILTGELRKLCTCLAFALFIRKSGSLIRSHKVLSWSCLLQKKQKPCQGSILAGQGKNYTGLPSR